jgi:hypothetical protein
VSTKACPDNTLKEEQSFNFLAQINLTGGIIHDIDRRVLDGFNWSQHQHPHMRTPLEAELGRLIAAVWLSFEVLAGGAFPR